MNLNRVPKTIKDSWKYDIKMDFIKKKLRGCGRTYLYSVYVPLAGCHEDMGDNSESKERQKSFGNVRAERHSRKSIFHKLIS